MFPSSRPVPSVTPSRTRCKTAPSSPVLTFPSTPKSQAVKALGGPLAELQALEFVLNELGLYLDTHQDDKEAFTLYQQYAALEKQARAAYEAANGPSYPVRHCQCQELVRLAGRQLALELPGGRG